MRKRFRKRSLAVARWPNEENSVARLEVVGPQQINAVMLLDEFAGDLHNFLRQDQILEATLGKQLLDKIGEPLV
jgi:hypothetical protein